MRTAIIWYGDIKYGIEIPEMIMDILSAFIAEVLEEQDLSQKEEWYRDLHYDFDERARGHRRDMSSMDFIEDLQNNKSREEEMIALLELTKNKISQEEDILTPERLDKFEQLKDWGEEYTTNWEGRYLKRDDFIQVLDNIIKLLRHEWNKIDYTAPFEGFLPGGWPES